MTNSIEKAKSALPHLLNYQQADEDGVMVLVSRQAVDEVAAGFQALQARVSELERENEALEELKDDYARDCERL